MFLEALSQGLLQLLLLSLLVQTVLLLDPVQLSLLLRPVRGLVLLVLIHGQVQGGQDICSKTTYHVLLCYAFYAHNILKRHVNLIDEGFDTIRTQSLSKRLVVYYPTQAAHLL